MLITFYISVYFEFLCPLLNKYTDLCILDKTAEDYLTKVIEEAINTRKAANDKV